MSIVKSVLTRDVLFALLIIGSVSVLLGTGTWAFFQDVEQSRNTIEAGTMNVTLDGADSQVNTFALTNATPTDPVTHNYTIQNAGTVPADHLEIGFSFTENDSGRVEPSDANLNAELNGTETASLINVTKMEYQDSSGAVIVDVLANVSDDNGNGIVDLQDAKRQTSSFDNLTPPQANGGNSTHFVISVQVANDDSPWFGKGANTAGNLTGYDEDIMADGVDITIKFVLNQDSSQ